jgi:putative PIN family toxin of toxin-antitoxin system
MRVVLDSNVIISALLVDVGPSARVLDAVRAGRLTWVLSSTILDEVARVLALPRIKRKYKVDEDAVHTLLTLLGAQAVCVRGVVHVEGRSRDPKDDSILACAVDGHAAYLVTGDRDLLDLGTYESIPIVPPAAFVKILERTGS